MSTAGPLCRSTYEAHGRQGAATKRLRGRTHSAHVKCSSSWARIAFDSRVAIPCMRARASSSLLERETERASSSSALRLHSASRTSRTDSRRSNSDGVMREERRGWSNGFSRVSEEQISRSDEESTGLRPRLGRCWISTIALFFISRRGMRHCCT
jgi:hypothetical protein